MNRQSLLSFAIALLPAALWAADAPKLEVVRSAGNGPWSKGTTWEGGKIPAADANVLIRTGHQVTYDVATDDAIRSVHIGGKLSFDPTRDTKLVVGLIKIQPGENVSDEGFDCDAHTPDAVSEDKMPVLEVGTPSRPIPAGKTAVIRLKYFEGTNKESWPAIVCCGGRMDFHGAPLSHSWVKLGATVAAESKELSLSHAVTGWKVGDMVILTPAQNGYEKTDITEERRIASIDGTKLTLDTPLKNEHTAVGDFRGEVANLSRNVVVESIDPEGERGHTMYHRYSAGSISYAEFRHLGKKDVLGRYSIHFHLIGNTMRGSYVQGASIWDSNNRWVTIHGTNYLVVRDCVGYKSVGHGFFMEDGTEVYNVLDRNLAVAARKGKKLPKQVLPFDSNNGAGYWWANSLNTFTRNVAVNNDQYGFRFEAIPSSAMKSLALPILQPDGQRENIDIRTLPFVRFDDNEVHNTYGLYGINLGEGVNGVGPDDKHPFVMRNTKIWNVHYGFRPQVPSLMVENMVIRSSYGVYHPNFDKHVYRNLTIISTNTEPFNRGHDDLSVQHGLLTVDGLTFDNMRSGGMPLIQISDQNSTGAAETHMRNVKTTNWNDGSKARAIVNLGGGPRPQPKTDKGVPIYLHDWYGPGRHAMVVSTRSPEYKAAPEKFKSEPPLTGNESAVAEVKEIPFPELLHPVDDLPPQTIITSVLKQTDGKLLVRGTSADNNGIKRVSINGQEAKSLGSNFSEWEITLPMANSVVAHAEDEKGNVEKLKHEVKVK